jgi:hypothetical protein
MDTQQILALLEYNRGAFPRAAVAEAIALGPRVSAELIDVLKRVRANAEQVPGDFVQHIFALYLLAQGREGLAYDVVLDLVSLPEATVDSLLGQVVTEALGRIVASLAHEQDGPMTRMIEREDVGQYVRGAMLRGLATSCVEGEVSRERLVGYLSELFSGERIRRRHSALWDELIVICLDLGLVDLRAQVERAFDDGLVDEMVVRREEAVRYLAQATGAMQPRYRRRYSFVRDTIAEMEWWACFRPPEESLAEPLGGVPSVRASRVGRNDPCPCGSGRKYKKCCLPALGAAGAGVRASESP